MDNQSESSWRQTLLTPNATIDEAIRNLDKTGIKIVLVVDEAGVLQGTISDGDIRRGLLRGLSLQSSLSDIIHRNALVVLPEMARDLVMRLMVANKVQQIPVVDEQHRVIDLYLWNKISSPPDRPNLMVIMAGGMGTRLHPHTQNCPKPLLPIAGKPMLEHIIQRGKAEGFSHFVIAIHYLGHMIEEHFGNGENLGVRIDYLREKDPLGTAGALSLLTPKPNTAFVVTNGDVITDIHYGELLDFHIRHHASATMAVQLHELRHPFGIVQTDGIKITGFEEKPVYQNHINAGIYVLNPEALNFLHTNECCDMPSLFERIQSDGQCIVAYPMHEPWLDVGRPADLITANKI
jgi:dTDP-glucose pyrophosphorylase/CBS domain-containing protein